MMSNYSEGSIARCTCRFRRRVHQPLQQYEATIFHYHRLPFIKHEVLVIKKFKNLNLLRFVWFIGCEDRIQTENVCEQGAEVLFSLSILWERGTRWRSWLRHCATSRKVAGSIPDGVIGIFHWQSPSGRTMALGFTQPLTEMSTRNISWG